MEDSERQWRIAEVMEDSDQQWWIVWRDMEDSEQQRRIVEGYGGQ
jgi:hypothetical protein